MSETLYTPRLELVPMTLGAVEAVLLCDRERAEAEAGVRFPDAWPNRDLVARAFTVSLDAIRADPARRLWGDRLMVARTAEPGVRRVVGSVVFHGFPEEDGVAEVGYGVETASQRQGLATEAVGACIAWALAQPGVRAVRAVTVAWNVPSVRVLEKCGMRLVGTRDHDMLELLVFERHAGDPLAPTPSRARVAFL